MSSAAKKIKAIPKNSMAELLDLNSGVIRSANCAKSIGVGSELNLENLLSWVSEYGFRHIVQKGSLAYDCEIMTSNLMLQRPDLFLAFPLSSILRPEMTSVKQEQKYLLSIIDIEKFADRVSILEHAADVAKGYCRPDVVNNVLLIADELLSYSIFNAPHGEFKMPSRYDLEEGLMAPTTQLSQASLLLGADEHRFVIACRDPHGTINVSHLIKSINDFYAGKIGIALKTAEEDASTEAFQMINSSIAFYAGFRRGLASVLCCVVPRNMSSRKLDEQPKNFHYFCESF